MKRRRRTLWRGVVFCALLAFIGPPAGAQQSPKSPGQPNAPAQPHTINPPGSNNSRELSPVVLDLDVGGNEVVGGGIVATFAVMAQRLLEPVRIEIILPEGIQKTAGELTWQGAMGPGEVRIVEISAQLSSPGSKKFIGKVTLPPSSPGGAPQVLTVEKMWEVKKAGK